MIKKTLAKAAVGTLAAGAMVLPATATVAPSIQLMACDYPDRRDTNTEQVLSRYAVDKGRVTSFVSVSSLDGGGSPNGWITVTVSGPGKDRSKTKKLNGSETSEEFRFGGWGKKRQGTYAFVASFDGFCQYGPSADTDHVVVTR